jgi:lysophospholipase L1-like esterase
MGSTLVAGAITEGTIRTLVQQESSVNPFRHNPIIAAQTSEEVFFPDTWLGHRMAPEYAHLFSKDYDSLRTAEAREHPSEVPYQLIGKGKIQPLNEVLSNLDRKKKIILNLGDSSTSGWDSDAVTRNRILRNEIGRVHPIGLDSPFFQYPTYSDILGEQEGVESINAGVPGYASLQGARYLDKLLSELTKKDIKVDYVTIYFGNNDGVCNGNVEDKYVIPAETFEIATFGFLKSRMQGFSIVPRTSVSNYEDNLRAMVETAKKYGAQPILVRPLIPKHWLPGLRATGREKELKEAMKCAKGTKLVKYLQRAITLYQDAVEALKDDHPSRARQKFVEAQNLDFMVPRIKPAYVDTLQKVAQDAGVALVDVDDKIPVDDRKYFVDYCHPIEPANRLIASAIGGILNE